METKIIKLDADHGVEKNRAKEMEAAFFPMINFLKEMEGKYNEIVVKAVKAKNRLAKDTCNEARALRLQYVKSRTTVDDIHRKGKREVLLLGRAWDSLKNQYLYITDKNEATLKKIEKHFEILEAEKRGKLREEREKALAKYGVEAQVLQLGEMNKEVWDIYFAGVKSQHENKIAAEKKEEEDRIAKRKAVKLEQERIKIENIKLQKEAKAMEKTMRAEWLKAEAKQKAIEEKTRKEKEIAKIKSEKAEEKLRNAMQTVIRQEEAQRKIIEDKAQEERNIAAIKAKKEVEVRKKLEDELQVKKDTEKRAEADRLAAIQAELSKGDKEKFQSFISDLEKLKTKYIFKSSKYKNLHISINESIDKIIIQNKSNEST